MDEPQSLLSPLGIYGWERIEPVIMAGVLLGEPVLLIGEPGSAKTYLGQVLSKALSPEEDFGYGYYDLSRANFEDIIGFPNPEAFKQGRSEFIHNPTTIWDKQIIMVDEVSRAQRETANKWLEILGVRSLMGQALNLKVILGGMNPPEHVGASPLPEAFADRFILFARLPEFSEMKKSTRKAILESKTGLDAPSIGFWQKGSSESLQIVNQDQGFKEASQALRDTLERAAYNYQDLQNSSWAARVERYADLFSRALLEANTHLEARRLKMIKRAILATAAVRMAQTGAQRLETEEALASAAQVVRSALPHPYTEQSELSREQIEAAHAQAGAALKGDSSELELFQAQSQAERLAMLLQGDYSPTVQEKVCADFLADSSLEADMTAWVCGQLILQDQAVKLPAHCLDRLAKRFQQCEERLTQTSESYIEPDLDCVEQLHHYAQAQQLVEKADRRVDTRIACAWALSQSQGEPRKVLELYPQALQALERSMQALRPLAIDWKIEGAENWQPAPKPA